MDVGRGSMPTYVSFTLPCPWRPKRRRTFIRIMTAISHWPNGCWTSAQPPRAGKPRQDDSPQRRAGSCAGGVGRWRTHRPRCRWHQHHRAEDVLVGSIAERLIQLAPCSVGVVKQSNASVDAANW